jgi:hypothetical protein
MNGIARVWKHPFNLDTFVHLDDARMAYPHVAKFDRAMWAGDFVLVRQMPARNLVTMPQLRAHARFSPSSLPH